VRGVAVEEVGDDPGLAQTIDLFRNLAADLEGAVGQRHLRPPAREFELELALRAGEHDERPLGAGNLDRRIQNDAARSECPEALEEHRDLPKVVAGAGRRLAGAADLGLARQEHQVGAAAPAEADAVARLEVALGRRLPVDESAVPRRLVPEDVLALLERDFSMLARHFAAAEPQVVGFAPADGERQAIDRNEARAENVPYFQTRRGHKPPASLQKIRFQRRYVKRSRPTRPARTTSSTISRPRLPDAASLRRTAPVAVVGAPQR